MLGVARERLREALAAFRAVFSNVALRRVEASWALSVTAYWVFIIALSLFAYEEGGAAAVGLVGLIRVLPSVVAAPFAALLGDRYPRQRVIFFVNVARTIAIAAAAAVALLGVHIGFERLGEFLYVVPVLFGRADRRTAASSGDPVAIRPSEAACCRRPARPRTARV